MVLPRDYARPVLDKRRLGQSDQPDQQHPGGQRGRRLLPDVLGRVYEYFLSQFASAAENGGKFCTPRCLVKVMVKMLEPYRGRVYAAFHVLNLPR